MIVARKTSKRGVSMNSEKMNRRNFIGTTAAVAAATIVPRRVLGGANFVAPSDKINGSLF